MKKIFIAILAAAAAFAGCNKTEIENGGALGTLRFSLNPSVDESYNEKGEGMLGGVSAQKASTRAVDNEAILNSMLVTISNNAGAGEPRQWTYSEMPPVLELTEGSYTITAVSSGDNRIAAWDQPIYGGTKEFSIVAGSTSTVELVCSITNVKVSINCTENFRSEFGKYTITVRSAEATAEDGFLTWSDTDTENWRDGYFSAADLTVTVQGYRWSDATQQNDPVQAVLNITDVQPKDHITVNIDAKATGEAGLGDASGDGASFITIDDGTNERHENIDIPGLGEIPVPGDGDEPDPEPDPELPDAPTLVWVDNPDFEPVLIEKGMSVDLVVNAPGAIAGFAIDINSPTLNPIIGTTLDLLDPETAATYAPMLPTGDQLLGKTTVDFPLSDLVPLIATVGAEPGSEHIFTLTVTDEYDQALEQSLTFVMPE